MKTKLTGILALLNLLLFLQLPAQTNEAPPETVPSAAVPTTEKNNIISGYIDINYNRHYLWRGALWGNNDISQPEIHIDCRNFSFGLSSNLNLVPRNLSMDFYKQKVVLDEYDIELSYQNSIRKLEYQVQLLSYAYFKQINTPNTVELCANFKYPLWSHTKVFTENAADIASYKGAFYNSTGLIYEREINNLTLEYKLFTCFANSGFNSAYYGTDINAVNFIGTSFYLEYSLMNNFYLAVKGEYNQYTNKEIQLSTGLKKTDNFGINFGLEF